MSNITSTGPAPLATNPPDPLTTASPAIGKDARGRPVAENPHPTTRARERQQLAQTINRNTFGFASRVVKVNSDGSSAQASTGRPRSTAIGPSSSSSTTSVGERQSKSPSANSQSNSSIGQTGNPTALQNKTDDAQFQQLIDTSEKFLTAANKLNEMRAQYEDQSGISKYLPGNQNKTAMRAAQQELGQQIQNYQFSQDPQINGSIINLWLAAASDLSLQDQKVIYNQIQQKLLSSEYRQEILQTLNAQRDNPQIAALRDAYNIKAESERIVEDFRSDLTAVLNGSMEDKTAFIKQFNKGGNLNLNNQPTQIIQKEQAAIKELLGKDNLTPSNRVFLQQMDLAYEAKLSENDPKKLLDAEKQFLSNGIRYLTDRLNPPIDSQQTKQLLATAGIFSQMVNTMFPMPAPKWPCASKDEALKTVQFSCIAQFVPRLSLLVREIDKGVEKSNQAHLQHALDEYRSVTEHMMPMLELAQTRIENMPLKVLNRVNSEIISAALIDTYDEQYGITQEMRRRAGGEN